MAETMLHQEILETLSGLKEEVSHLKKDMHQIMEYLEDSRLTEEEKKMVDQSIANRKAGKYGVSHEDLKRKLRL